jgi:hypothetical protein
LHRLQELPMLLDRCGAVERHELHRPEQDLPEVPDHFISVKSV